MKGRLTKKEKAIVIADIINVYNQAIAKKRLAKSSHNNDYFSKDDHELIFTIEQALRNCSKETRLIIKNDFIYKQEKDWYLDYFSKSTYYRYQNSAMDEFINSLNI